MKFLLQYVALLPLLFNDSRLRCVLSFAPTSNKGHLPTIPTKRDLFATSPRCVPLDDTCTTNFHRNDKASIEFALNDMGVNTSVEILSISPLIYKIPKFLTPEECESYRKYVYEQCSIHNARNLTRSNPPQVSLDIKKLWPLPLLSLLAGIPPYIHLKLDTNTVTLHGIVVTVLPTILFTLIAMGVLGFAIILPILRKSSDSSSRTSDAIALNMEQDLGFIGALVDRATACVWTKRSFSWENWEAPVVTRYDKGSIFARHGDASPTRGSEWYNIGGQRIVTCICYLNTLSEGQGGGTYFDKIKLRIQPQQGTALFFYPADATSFESDERTTHESLPPLEEKWIVQLFGRVNSVPPPLGLLQHKTSQL